MDSPFFVVVLTLAVGALTQPTPPPTMNPTRSPSTNYFRLTFAGTVAGNGKQFFPFNGDYSSKTEGNRDDFMERMDLYLPFDAYLEYASWSCSINTASTTFLIYDAAALVRNFTTTAARTGVATLTPFRYPQYSWVYVAWAGGSGSNPGYTTLTLWFSYFPPTGAFIFPLTWGGGMSSAGPSNWYQANGYAYGTYTTDVAPRWWRNLFALPFDCAINASSWTTINFFAPFSYSIVDVNNQATLAIRMHYIAAATARYSPPLEEALQGDLVGIRGNATAPAPGPSQVTLWLQATPPPSFNPSYFTVVFGGNIGAMGTRTGDWLILNGSPETGLGSTALIPDRHQLAVPWASNFQLERVSYSIESRSGTTGGQFNFEKGADQTLATLTLNPTGLYSPPSSSLAQGVYVFPSPVAWTTNLISVKFVKGTAPFCEATPGRTVLLLVFRRL